VAFDAAAREIEDAFLDEFLARPDAVTAKNAGFRVFVGQLAPES
jgi:hypothetical protein